MRVFIVNQNYEWMGANLQEDFQLAELIGEGAFGQVRWR